MPELIGKLQATFKSTLHPSPLFTRKICVTFFKDLTVLSLLHRFNVNSLRSNLYLLPEGLIV